MDAMPAYDADYRPHEPTFQQWRERVSVQVPIAPNQIVTDQPRYFWMDTLCVPVSPSNIRKDAIVSMREVHSDANRALVLDTDLRSSSIFTSPEEKLARITCSSWVHRLWTLQEAALVPKLYFQFAEAPFLFDLYPNRDSEEKQYDNPIGEMAQQNEFTRKVLTLAPLDKMAWTFQSLRSRATSRDGDQAICIATLVDIDLAELLSVPESDRVRKLWSMFKNVPAATLFLPGKKLQDPVHGWAPANCMDCRHLGMPLDVPAAITLEGVRVSLPGFFIASPVQPVDSVIAVSLQSTTFYVRKNTKFSGASWDGLNLHKVPRLAVLLPKNPCDGGRVQLVASIAALVSVVREEEDECCVEYLRFVSVISQGCRHDFAANPAWSAKEEVEKEMIGQASLIQGNQKWLISGVRPVYTSN